MNVSLVGKRKNERNDKKYNNIEQCRTSKTSEFSFETFIIVDWNNLTTRRRHVIFNIIMSCIRPSFDSDCFSIKTIISQDFLLLLVVDSKYSTVQYVWTNVRMYSTKFVRTFLFNNNNSCKQSHTDAHKLWHTTKATVTEARTFTSTIYARP